MGMAARVGGARQPSSVQAALMLSVKVLTASLLCSCISHACAAVLGVCGCCAGHVMQGGSAAAGG